MNCMTPRCHGQAADSLERGICLKCYGVARRLVESGQTTWEKLEEAGLVMRRDDPFMKAYNSKEDK